MKKIILFVSKCLLICLGALALLFALNFRYEQARENPYSDAEKFHFMNSDYTNIQICNLGSSHGEYAFYYDELTKEQGYECFNFAMASQTYNYDYAIFSMYQEHFSDDCLLFIPVSYFSFNNEVTDDEEAQFLNAKYYTFLSPQYIPDYDPYVDITTHYLPILSAKEDIVKIFPDFTLKASAAETRQDGPSGLSAKEEEFREKARNRYHRHMDNKEEYFLAERIENLYDIIALCKEKGITAVFITTPYTEFYSELFSKEFKEEFHHTINIIARTAGIPYYDYSEDARFRNNLEYFSDADHLNIEGAARFMDIIKKEIPEFQEFLQNTT